MRKRLPGISLAKLGGVREGVRAAGLVVAALASVLMVAVLVTATITLIPAELVQAKDPVDDIQDQIDELAHLRQLSEDATEPLESEVDNLEARVQNARHGIVAAKKQVAKLADDIAQRELELAGQFEILSKRIAAQYKRQRHASPLMIFFASQNATKLKQGLAYQNTLQVQDNRLIGQLGSDIEQLEADRAKLESDQLRLAALEKQLDDQAEFFRGEIAKARDYQQVLSSQIAELTAKQQAIINARQGTFTTSVGEVPLADDFNASIGFKAQAPSNSFAVFSFGAFTHRNGMSQYGAKARAESGQSVEDILRAYYPGTTLKKDFPATGSISVQGVGTIPFEEQYLQGIFEMPGSWHINALKAQAIAARTFAIRHTNNGQGSICTTEACQVFKNQRKGGNWEKAVNETRGWVLVDGSGNPVSSQYASTHGGYSNTGGWDTTDGSGNGDWASRAWDAKAPSPWFYKAWYRVGYSVGGASCGRGHPWLSEREFADIINAWIVRGNPNGADAGRIQPVTINDCPIGTGGGNPYSIDELRDRANSSGGAVTSISGVSVSHSSQGQTVTVSVNTNRGTLNIPGSEFKTAFNLRAPGHLRIPQSGFGFFNVEHKR